MLKTKVKRLEALVGAANAQGDMSTLLGSVSMAGGQMSPDRQTVHTVQTFASSRRTDVDSKAAADLSYMQNSRHQVGKYICHLSECSHLSDLSGCGTDH